MQRQHGFPSNRSAKSIGLCFGFFASLFLILLLYAFVPFMVLAQDGENEADSDLPDSRNLLSNVGFETGALYPWQKYGAGNIGIGTCCALRGAYSAYVQPNGNYTEIYQKLLPETDRRYRLTALVATESGQTATLGWYSNITKDQNCGSTTSTSTVKLLCDFVLPSGTTNFNVHLSSSALSGKIKTDSWALKQLGPYFYAKAQKSGTFQGVSARISTAIPSIKEEEHAYHTINIQNKTMGKYVEVGWIRTPYSNPPCQPQFAWATQENNPVTGANVHFVDWPIPTVGVSYDYYIYKKSDGAWWFEVRKTDGTYMIPPMTILNSGFNNGDFIEAGGEIVSLSGTNDLGVSNLKSLSWRDANGNWSSWGGYLTRINAPLVLAGLNPDANNNIQVYGNQGLAVPPGAPCP